MISIVWIWGHKSRIICDERLLLKDQLPEQWTRNYKSGILLTLTKSNCFQLGPSFHHKNIKENL